MMSNEPLADTKEIASQGVASTRRSLVPASAKRRSKPLRKPAAEDPRLVLEASNDGAWDWNIPACTVHYSNRLLRMLGYKAHAWAANIQSWADRVHPDDIERVRARRNELLEGRVEFYQSEYRLRRADGGWQWILDRGKVVQRGPDGSAIRAIGVHTDISHLKAAPQDHPPTNREQELNRLQSSFISLVSHEFRTPLAHILMSAEMLQDCYPQLSESRRTQCFTAIRQGVNMLVSMMQDTLTLGELEKGVQQASPTPVDLATLCEDSIKQSRLTPGLPTTDKQPAIRTLFDCPHPRVLLDPRLVSLMLSNLLSNAIKYSSRHNRQGSVTLRAEVLNERLVFEIEDDGIGVPPEDRPRLFTSFFRAGNVRPIPGTGLGLALVKLCARMHDGRADYRPATLQGSVFSIDLPLIPCTTA